MPDIIRETEKFAIYAGRMNLQGLISVIEKASQYQTYWIADEDMSDMEDDNPAWLSDWVIGLSDTQFDGWCEKTVADSRKVAA